MDYFHNYWKDLVGSQSSFERFWVNERGYTRQNLGNIKSLNRVVNLISVPYRFMLKFLCNLLDFEPQNVSISKKLADEINFHSKKLFWVKVSRLEGFSQSSYSVKIRWSLPLCSEEKLASSCFNISQTLYVGCLIERLDLVVFI